MDLIFWDKQISRASELAAQSAANELLNFYARVLSAQRDIYEFLWKSAPQVDLKVLSGTMPILLKAVEETGSPQLRDEMQSLETSTPTDIFNMLLEYSTERSPTQFFAKALFQPYGRWSSECDGSVSQVNRQPFCPHCNGLPQVSCLQFDPSSESANRSLICATCLFPWSFRRGMCASCGEESPSKLSYFQADQQSHIKVESCESCRSYIKSIDLTQLGIASPLVDDVASAALDVWAAEKGYTKIEINLVGL